MAKKSTTAPKAPAPAPAAADLVTVQVIKQPLYENNAHHFQGQTFQTTPERAAALASLVTIIP